MSSTLKDCLPSTFIAIKERDGFSLNVSAGWKTLVLRKTDPWNLLLSQAPAGARNLMLIVGEQDLVPALAWSKEKNVQQKFGRVGVVVVSNSPELILRAESVEWEILDAITPAEFQKTWDTIVLKNVRHLLRSNEKNEGRVNQKTLEQLNQIFIDLSAERDPQKLLASILVKALELGAAHSGCLYMIEENDGELFFRLRLTADRSTNVGVTPLQQKVLENSVCGYVALTGKLYNIPKVDELRPMTLPQYSKTIDFGSEVDKVTSVLTLPLKNGRNEIIAILQLANKILPPAPRFTEDETFSTEDESLLVSFTTQASICLENVDLYRDIQRLFEGFVRASISAIESRDPSTGGHSERVAKICVALARATTEVNVGIYRSVRFKEEEIRELEYAALLHDFGKIGVREEVLVKAKKLYAWQLDSIRERLKVCKAAVRIAYLEQQVKRGGSHPAAETEYGQRVESIDRYWQIILAANEPTVIKKENIQALDRIRDEQLLLPDGSQISLLTEEEYSALSVMKGSLTENERLEIESHVRHTYQFLKMIPWTKDFKHLPEIAYAHHEKLDGSGYPRGLVSHEIPLQSKIMTIADIFDALTAADRWYKEAVPMERALEILAQEVGQGKMDPVLFELFVERKVYEVTHPRHAERASGT